LRGFARNLGQVVAHGRSNPRFGLVMTMGFVIRADYFVMLSFVSLWVVNAAADRGIATVVALETAGLLTITLKIATAMSQALFGFVADRVRRPTLLVLSLTATGFTLCATSLVTDVFGPLMFLVVALVGIAESALIVCGQAMLGEEAPPALRGSAMGIFYFTGTLGVVVTSAVSGLLFDRLGYSAPFVLIGLLNLAFALLGVRMLWSESRRRLASAPRSDS
jgi:MFS family permease